MNAKMIDAIRKESFVQGYLYAREDMCESRLTPEEVLELLPAIDEAYRRHRQPRSPK